MANNFIINNGGGGQALYLHSVTNLDIYHNSALHINGNSSSSAFYIYSGNENNIVNNIFINKGAGYAYYVGSNGAISTSDYNNLYVYGDYVGYWDGNLGTLADFQNAGSTDANSISTNPGFFSHTDLHAVSSVIDSAGMPLGRIMYDIDGELRNATHPDIGADEFDSTAVVSIDDDLFAGNTIPKEFKVYNNFPNPFNPVTFIRYDLPSAGHVKVQVYNILGQVVATLVDKEQSLGTYTYRFDGINLASGTYIYRITTGKHTVVRKMILHK
jgi:hypothetical protein